MVKQVVKRFVKVVKVAEKVVFNRTDNLCLLATFWGMCDVKQRGFDGKREYEYMTVLLVISDDLM